MLKNFIGKILGSANDRIVKSYDKTVSLINDLEPKYHAMSDEDLRAQTDVLRQRLANGDKEKDILPDAFALVREAANRAIGLRHFNVQLIGGMVLNNGQIAEMKTGEGKTLVATLALYLKALHGRGAHLITVNDYLASRDADWMGQVYRFLGLTVGVIQHDMTDDERRAAYACDITYVTNSELGFDYLRDNMKFNLEERVQRDFNFAIVDEVDSILIDEARTPLIISGAAEDSSERYITVNKIIPQLTAADYEKVVEAVEGKPYSDVIQTALLRSMQRAVYSPDNIGHYGLGYEGYTHFTSPIRRYPDLLVHRTIRGILSRRTYRPQVYIEAGQVLEGYNGKSLERTLSAMPKPQKSVPHEPSYNDWTTLGKITSACERRADDASRDVVAWLKCRYMTELAKQRKFFTARINTVTQFGIFVELLDHYVEGFVHISNLGFDYYDYMIDGTLVGRDFGETYSVGQIVKVKLIGVDEDRRRIDFRIA